MHEETAQVITNTIAVATTLILPRLLVLLQLCMPSIARGIGNLSRFIRYGSERVPERLTLYALETVQEAGSIGAAARGLACEHLGMEYVEIAGKYNTMIVLSEIT